MYRTLADGIMQNATNYLLHLTGSSHDDVRTACNNWYRKIHNFKNWKKSHHNQNLFNCFLSQSLQISQKFILNCLCIPANIHTNKQTNKQIDRQTKKRTNHLRQIHNHLGRGNNYSYRRCAQPYCNRHCSN